jgi:hypothetical protein
MIREALRDYKIRFCAPAIEQKLRVAARVMDANSAAEIGSMAFQSIMRAEFCPLLLSTQQ